MRSVAQSYAQIPTEDIEGIVGTMHTIWGRGNDLKQLVGNNMSLFGVDTNDDITVVYNQYVVLMEHVRHMISSVENELLHEQVNDIYRQMALGYESLLTLHHQNMTKDNVGRLTISDMGSGSASFIPMDNPTDLKVHQQLLNLLVGRARKHGLCKKGGGLYKRILTPEGFDTRTYELYMDVKTFVHSEARPNSPVWEMLTDNRSNARMCVDFLSDCSAAHIPHLDRTRWLFAFRNGIFNAMTTEFIPYDDDTKHRDAGNGICSIYHDILFGIFPPGTPPEEIPTPSFDKIFTTQGLGEAELFIFYAFVGRMFFPTGKLDNWQVWLNFVGCGGCGKSTILKQIEKVYSDADVATLESVSPRDFAFAHLPGSFILTIHDIDSKCTLRPTDLFVFISGERTTIHKKYEQPIQFDFDIQGAMGGNTYPPWPDFGGSAVRRLLSFSFPRLPPDSDPYLSNRCAQERSMFIQKSAKCYKKLREMHDRTKDIWSPGILPQSFHENKMRMKAECNPLQAFLLSGRCTLGGNEATTFQDFKQHFHMFTKDERLPNSAKCLSVESRRHIFKAHGIKMVNPSDNNGGMPIPGMPTSMYMVGITLNGAI